MRDTIMDVKQRRAIGRIITQASIFLLLGAIVNIVVAWGIAVAYEGSFKQTDGWGVIEQSTAGDSQNWEYILFDRGPAFVVWWSPRTMREWLPPTPTRPQWSSPPILSEEDQDRYPDWHFVELCSGWPRMSMKCRAGCASAFTRAPGAPFAHGGIQWGEIKWMLPPAILPLAPVWPGFAINTLFYAAILWLLFAARLVLPRYRRLRRIKRGLCPACAYPIGTSPVCTECGQALPERVGFQRA